MRGKNLVCSVVVGLVLMFQAVAYAQVCEYPDPSQADPDTYIVIDGTVYEYVDIETSKERLKAVQENKSLKEKIDLLEKKVEAKDSKIEVLEERIEILNDSSQMDRELIDKLFANGFHDPKDVPIWKRPAFNYAFGLATAGGLFFLWKYADRPEGEK